MVRSKRLLALLLATIILLATGCGTTLESTANDPQQDMVGVADSDEFIPPDTEIVQLTVDNLDSEAEMITKDLLEKGLNTSFEEVRAVLLHMNREAFSEEEYYSLFADNLITYEDTVTSEEKLMAAFFKKCIEHNIHNVFDFGGELDKLVGVTEFCRNAKDYKALAKLEDCTLSIAEAVAGDSKNIDDEMQKNIKPFSELTESPGLIRVGEERFSVCEVRDEATVLSDGTVFLIYFSYMYIYNYVWISQQEGNVKGETMDMCEDVFRFASVAFHDAELNILNNIRNTDFSR